MSEQYVCAELALSPEGELSFNEGPHCAESFPLNEFQKIRDHFAKGFDVGLIRFGLSDPPSLPPGFRFWHSFLGQFLAKICQYGTLEAANLPPPRPEQLQTIVDGAPFLPGIEHLSQETLSKVWKRLHGALRKEVGQTPLQVYLSSFHPRWNLVGKVCLHLAENRGNPTKPFAFLATFAADAQGRHLPLKRAIQETAKEGSTQLLSLLVPVQKAAAMSPFVRKLLDTGMIFEPTFWSAREAYEFLREAPLMEQCGVSIRIPNWWSPQKPPRPQIKIGIGSDTPSSMGLDALLSFDVRVALGDQELTPEEWKELARQASQGLVQIKGQWVEIDPQKLNQILSKWEQLKESTKAGLSLAESLRLLAGIDSSSDPGESEWVEVESGGWLKGVLEQLKAPQPVANGEKILGANLQGKLRPYQKLGVEWLCTLYRLKLGGCLADDMGLGKTIQVLSLLLIIREMSPSKPLSLLVVPASLIGNWQAEASRFSPSLKLVVAHHSLSKKPDSTYWKGADLVVTTYGFLQRCPSLQEQSWDLVILDEAQAIKNPATKQTRAVKGLKSERRLALTGTPIENRLSDFWSLFDFLAPGLLKSQQTFSQRLKQGTTFVSSLRRLTQPYLLRRLKSDRRIIADLPDKTEMKSFCTLSKEQAAHYLAAVEDLSKKLREMEGIQRRGLVLSSLIRLKQICNHPAQFLGVGDYREEESGKWQRLREICEEIAAKQEKALIFTQFTEIMPPLFAFLTQIFGKEGLMLSGKTAVKVRPNLVQQFQEGSVPFFLLSLKAGGTGLNLTSATHVIHFDRWWNPAVENQATDRAYRIGQKHPVLVHPFICRGTIEEKIDALIDGKKNLSKELLEGGSEILLTELSNEELLNLVQLDLDQAIGEK